MTDCDRSPYGEHAHVERFCDQIGSTWRWGQRVKSFILPWVPEFILTMGKKRRKKHRTVFVRRPVIHPPTTLDHKTIPAPTDQQLPSPREFQSWLDKTPEAKERFREFCVDNGLFKAEIAWRHEFGEI